MWRRVRGLEDTAARRKVREKYELAMAEKRRAADVVRAVSLLWCHPDDRVEFCDIIRRCIAGLPPEQADAALVGLFREIQICHDTEMESLGHVKASGNASRYSRYGMAGPDRR